MLWSALFHDIGKPMTRTDKIIKITSPDWDECNSKIKSNYIMHEKVGAEIALRLCEYLKFSNIKKKFIYDIVKNHLRVYDNMHKSENGAICDFIPDLERFYKK